MLNNKKSQSLFLDLKRGATAFYLNPKGKTYLVFLNHALKIVEKKGLKRKIERIKRRAARAKAQEVTNLADEMLTLGILIKKAI